MAQPLIATPQAQPSYQLNEELVQQSRDSFASFVAVDQPSTWIHQHDTPGETAGQVRL
jgi:hypothetical protein